MNDFIAKYGSFTNTNSKTSKLGYFGEHDVLRKRVYKLENHVVTICASENPIYTDGEIYRYLTSKENLLLMGFDSEDYNELKKVHNDNTISKQAGNSIVVNVVESIFKELL